MADALRRPGQIGRLVAFAVGLGLTAVAVGQAPPVPVVPKAGAGTKGVEPPAATTPKLVEPPAGVDSPLKAGTGTTLYFVVRANPDVTNEQMVNTLKAGLAPSFHAIDGVPIVKPISPYFFEQFAELIGSPRPKLAAATADTLSVGPLPSRENNLHEVRLPSPKQSLTKLTVKYDKADGKKETEDYFPSEPGAGPLTFIEPGRYSLLPAAGRTPVGLTATYDERDDKTKELVTGKELSTDWPKTNKHFAVTLNNFRSIVSERHNHEAYLNKVQEIASKRINGVQITRLGGDQLFVFANMSDDADTVDDFDIVGNELVIRIPNTRSGKASRVWVLFPLIGDEYTAALEKYSTFPITEMPGEVRKASVPASERLVVGPDTKPKWLEVLRDPASGTFTRRLPLTDLPGLAKKYPTVNFLKTWEGENLDASGRVVDREMIKIENAQKQKLTSLGGSIDQWSSKLKLAMPD